MNDWTEQDYMDVLQELDSMPAEVSDWEAKFIESNLNTTNFSDKQKKVIHSMHNRYLKKERYG